MLFLRLLTISSLILFFECTHHQKKNTTKDDDMKRFDTMEKIYCKLDTNEIYIKKDLLLSNNSYKMNIVKFCLNDSEIFKEESVVTGKVRKEVLKISSNYVYAITVFKDNEELFTKNIVKDQFKDFIDNEYFNKVVLDNIELERSDENALFFNIKIGIPDSDKAYELGFTFDYSNGQSRQLKYWILKRIEI